MYDTAQCGTMRTMLSVGSQAPIFKELKPYAKHWLLLYFYPKDNTPGCTKEACAFRDHYQELNKKLTVVGVSKDSQKSHDAFAQKHNLPFPLIADPEGHIINAYQAWGKKKFMGREYNGILRTSYLISPQGKIVKTYPNVKPADHAAEILKDLQVIK